MAASVSFMLALSLTGERYAWTSPPILGLYAVALVVGIGFVFRLLTAPEPLIPLSILSDKVARGAIVVNAFGWGPIVGLNIFMPMYLQSIIGMSATVAGLCVLVLPVALNASAGFVGHTIARVEHYKTLPMIGLAISIAAVLVLGWRAEDLPLWSFLILLAAIGIGFGAIPPLCSTVLQNTVPIRQFGTAVATMQFSRNLCCTIMVAVFGALVLVGAPTVLPDQLAPIVPGGGNPLGEYRAEGFSRVFYAAAASFAVALVALMLLEEKPLQTTHD